MARSSSSASSPPADADADGAEEDGGDGGDGAAGGGGGGGRAPGVPVVEWRDAVATLGVSRFLSRWLHGEVLLLLLLFYPFIFNSFFRPASGLFTIVVNIIYA